MWKEPDRSGGPAFPNRKGSDHNIRHADRWTALPEESKWVWKSYQKKADCDINAE